VDSTADHEFNPKIASNALSSAAAELASKAGKTVDDFDGMRMGTLFDLAVELFGDDLPDFWRVWNTWNTASDDPSPWGDL
jgi:hypothetical protein